MVANLSGLMLGYEMGLTSGVLLQLRGLLSLSCQEQELLVSAHVFGALFISLVGGPILDRYGRRCCLLLCAALVVVGTIVLIAITSLVSLTLGRVIVGMGTSLSGTAACLYIAEIDLTQRQTGSTSDVIRVHVGFRCNAGIQLQLRLCCSTSWLDIYIWTCNSPGTAAVWRILVSPTQPSLPGCPGQCGEGQACAGKVEGWDTGACGSGAARHPDRT